MGLGLGLGLGLGSGLAPAPRVPAVARGLAGGPARVRCRPASRGQSREAPSGLEIPTSPPSRGAPLPAPCTAATPARASSPPSSRASRAVSPPPSPRAISPLPAAGPPTRQSVFITKCAMATAPQALPTVCRACHTPSTSPPRHDPSARRRASTCLKWDGEGCGMHAGINMVCMCQCVTCTCACDMCMCMCLYG